MPRSRPAADPAAAATAPSHARHRDEEVCRERGPPDRAGAARRRHPDVLAQPATLRRGGADHDGDAAVHGAHHRERGPRRLRQPEHRADRRHVRHRRGLGAHGGGAGHRRLAGAQGWREPVAADSPDDGGSRPARFGHELDRGRRHLRPGGAAHREPHRHRGRPAHDAHGLCRADQRHAHAGGDRTRTSSSTTSSSARAPRASASSTSLRSGCPSCSPPFFTCWWHGAGCAARRWRQRPSRAGPRSSTGSSATASRRAATGCGCGPGRPWWGSPWASSTGTGRAISGPASC